MRHSGPVQPGDGRTGQHSPDGHGTASDAGYGAGRRGTTAEALRRPGTSCPATAVRNEYPIGKWATTCATLPGSRTGSPHAARPGSGRAGSGCAHRGGSGSSTTSIPDGPGRGDAGWQRCLRLVQTAVAALGRVPKVDLERGMILVRGTWRSDRRAMGGAGVAVAEGQQARTAVNVGQAAADQRHTVPGPHRDSVAGPARRVRAVGPSVRPVPPLAAGRHLASDFHRTPGPG